MKIGVITLVGDNYGNKFQNFAVEQLLSVYGEVETFALEDLYVDEQVQNKPMAKNYPRCILQNLRMRMKRSYRLEDVSYSLCYSLLYIAIHRRQLKNVFASRENKFYAFSNTYLHISPQKLNYENTKDANWVAQFDYYAIGSDQIWNPFYPTTTELAFGSFAPHKSIALSPSFGVAEIPIKRQAMFRDAMIQMKCLSVREKEGQQIVQNLTGRQAELLLDPTMAIPVSVWEKLARKPKVKLPKHYVLSYFLGTTDRSRRKECTQFAKNRKMPWIRLFHVMEPQFYDMDPAEVIYMIRNADYILTDSFHGMVFSILFHKNFVAFERNSGGASMESRMRTLLETFSLEDRYCTSSVPISEERWQKVDEKLELERRKIQEYLQRAISGRND